MAQEKMIRVGDYLEELMEKNPELCRRLRRASLGTIETGAHGNFYGALPNWSIPESVLHEMMEAGLDMSGLGVKVIERR
ncbi:MAG: hypothetical protein AAB961_00400 [Patescibacteria group bacterium]